MTSLEPDTPSSSHWIDPLLSLEGSLIRLEPLEAVHAQDLLEVGNDPAIWTYLLFDAPECLDDMRLFIERALAARATGAAVPFAVRHLASGRLIGSTRYLDIAPTERTLSVGWTWFGREWWRSGANIESKYLLFKHAFETAGAVRVQIRVDERNTQSRTAVEGLGAVFEGVLRRHMAARDGNRRSSAIYSVLDVEWPAVRDRLVSRLRAHLS